MRYSKLTELQGLKFRRIFTDGIIKRLRGAGIAPTPELNNYLSTFLDEMKPRVPQAWEEAMEEVL